MYLTIAMNEHNEFRVTIWPVFKGGGGVQYREPMIEICESDGYSYFKTGPKRIYNKYIYYNDNK